MWRRSWGRCASQPKHQLFAVGPWQPSGKSLITTLSSIIWGEPQSRANVILKYFFFSPESIWAQLENDSISIKCLEGMSVVTPDQTSKRPPSLWERRSEGNKIKGWSQGCLFLLVSTLIDWLCFDILFQITNRYRKYKIYLQEKGKNNTNTL